MALLLAGGALLVVLVRHQIALAVPRHQPSLRELLAAFGDPETLLETLGAAVVLVFSGVLFVPRRSVALAPIASVVPDAVPRLSDAPEITATPRLSDAPEITATPLETGLEEFPRSERPTAPGVPPPADFENNPFEAITSRPDRPAGEIPSVSVPQNPVPRVDEPKKD